MCEKKQKFAVYPSDSECTKFLLGGIGTGNFSIGTRGQFCDFEWFGQAGKGNTLPFAFPSIRCCAPGEPAITKLIESGPLPIHDGPHGHSLWETAGLPRFDRSQLSAKMPFVTVDFFDRDIPLAVSLEGFTPFIPLNADDSGIPGAILRYRVENPTEKEYDVSVCITMPNATGYLGAPKGKFSLTCPQLSHYVHNESVRRGKVCGINYTCHDPEYPRVRSNSMALVTMEPEATCTPEWIEGNLFEGIENFWEDFSQDGRLRQEQKQLPERCRNSFAALKAGSLCVSKTIKAGETETFTFCLAWYFPFRERGWTDIEPTNSDALLVKNYYATQFGSAIEAADYLCANLPRLERQSSQFADALYGSTLPGYVIEAAADNLTVLRSPTCMRIEDGTFLGWEGCFDQGGCCEGTCAHVWNYAQSVAFLFPELEISARRVEFLLETADDRQLAYRTQRVFGNPRWEYIPAADGQAGTLIRLYREWKLTGDDQFLKEVWPKAKASLQFLFRHFDPDGDLLPEAEQHNTYDTEFFGPNPLICFLLYGAVAAMREMAAYLGEAAYAAELSECFQKGTQRLDRLLWNGEYYVQRLEHINSYRCQFGEGCLSDQLLGQFLAFITGLGFLAPKEHVVTALKSIYQYNFSERFTGEYAVGRGYAMDDEPRLTICTWPKAGETGGERPEFPFFYADEVWTGVEYQVASSLIYIGEVKQGLKIAEAVRKRHDGKWRTPFNEKECGNHYARFMASWGLITALSGFRYDMPHGKIVSFDPKIEKDDFRTFFSTGRCWGIYHQKKSPDGTLNRWLEILYGDREVKLVL